MAKTPLRNVRVADDLWSAACIIASARGDNLSDVMRAALERYVQRNRDLMPPPPSG